MKDFEGIDCFSPEITLYCNLKRKHSSIISSVISIFYYVTFLCISLYYFYLLLSHQKEKFMNFKKYINDAGVFELNSSNFYHTITLQGNAKFEENAINVIGVQLRPTNSLILEDNDLIDHWIYKKCDDNKDELCIKQYYNSTQKKLLDLSNPNFPFPSVHSNSNKDNSIPYSILIQSCQESSEKMNSCLQSEEIEQIAEELRSIKIKFLDKFVELETYNNPFISRSNTFEVGIFTESISSTNFHFAPIIVRTNKGIIFNDVTEQRTYSFSQLHRGNYRKETKSLLGMLNFWIQNETNVYEREYYSFAKVVISIAGLSRGSWYFFFLINFFFSRHTMYKDFCVLYQKNYLRVIKINNANNGCLINISGMNLDGKNNGNNTNNNNTNNILMVKRDESLKIQKTVCSPACVVRCQTDAELFTYYKRMKSSLRWIICYFFKLKKDSFLDTLVKLRAKVLDEERMIKYYLIFQSIEDNPHQIEKSPIINLGKKLLSSFSERNKRNARVSAEMIDSSQNDLLHQNFFKTDTKTEKKQPKK